LAFTSTWDCALDNIVVAAMVTGVAVEDGEE
jgi:hypothetical protein